MSRQLTAQEAYEGIVSWFSRPKPVYGWDAAENSCAYRGGEAAASKFRCAVGCLMTAAEYRKIQEIDGPGDIVVKLGWDADGDRGRLSDFLSAAQSIHDACAEGSPRRVQVDLPRSKKFITIQECRNDLERVPAPFTYFLKKMDVLARLFRLQVATR